MKKFFAAAKLILTLKCEQSSRIVSDSMDRDLTSVERWAVRLHYIGCWSCRRFGRQMRQLREAFQSYPQRTTDSDTLSDEALERIRQAIQRD